ncbi:hypothetical protein [Desulfitobacterium sp.]|uniref:hypothetical protein n=1 Tax=Desulfitobacterium sp. TaxID=49981 RepID=UPI002B1F026D|nr:hypothetical protein [Desulfitobacterium sp.]MEA4901597.1 hypothetical protein [Desulfitobacterium sp.]
MIAEKSADFNVGEGDPKAIGVSAIFDTCGPAALEFEGLKNYYPTDVIGGFLIGGCWVIVDIILLLPFLRYEGEIKWISFIFQKKE